MEDRLTAVLADYYGARLLAWSVAVLVHAGAEIDRSLVSVELCGPDHSQPGHDQSMPGACGTLYLAARCVYHAGGTVVLAGARSQHGVKKPDIRWRPPNARPINFERKDRPFRVAMSDDARRLATVGASRCFGAADQLEGDREGDALRVGSWGVVTRFTTAEGFYRETMFPRAVWRHAQRSVGPSPDGFLAVVIGIGTQVRDGVLHTVSSLRTVFVQNVGSRWSKDDPAWAELRKAFLLLS